MRTFARRFFVCWSYLPAGPFLPMGLLPTRLLGAGPLASIGYVYAFRPTCTRKQSSIGLGRICHIHVVDFYRTAPTRGAEGNGNFTWRGGGAGRNWSNVLIPMKVRHWGGGRPSKRGGRPLPPPPPRSAAYACLHTRCPHILAWDKHYYTQGVFRCALV